jgi:hypothetical protein
MFSHTAARMRMGLGPVPFPLRPDKSHQLHEAISTFKRGVGIVQRLLIWGQYDANGRRL